MFLKEICRGGLMMVMMTGRGPERTGLPVVRRPDQTGACPQGVSQSPVISALSHQPGVSLSLWDILTSSIKQF